MSRGKIYFRNIDSIRFLAALMVYLQHGISPCYTYLPVKGTIVEKLLNTISNGGTGVSVFFVLSGFLITYLLISEHEIEGKVSVKNFYIRRILRIWPLYFLVVIFGFFIYPVFKSVIGMNNPLGSHVGYYLTFLSNFDVIHIEKFFPGHDAMSQNITWSVAIEEQFYVCWPLLFAFLPQRFWIGAILLVIAGAMAFRIANYNDDMVLYFHTLAVLPDLAMGGLMAYLIKTNNRIKSFFEQCAGWKHLLFFIFSFALVYFSDTIFSFPYGYAISRIFIALSFALIIAAQAITTAPSKLNLGNFSFMSRWGKYTYGIYLIHPIVLTLDDVAVRLLHLPKTNFASVFSVGVVGFVFTLLLSKLSYMYFESPFLRLKDKFSAIQSHE
jgi:peptidoglycan/LPS O-acetylase OafA/YrhL